MVNILAKNKRITLTVIRDFLVSHCKETARITQEAEEEAALIHVDTKELQQRVVALETEGLEFLNTKDHLFVCICTCTSIESATNYVWSAPLSKLLTFFLFSSYFHF